MTTNRETLETKRKVSKDIIEKHIKDIMELIGIEVNESTEGTPKRVAKMFVNELFVNVNNETIDDLDNSMKVFPNNGGSDLILLKDIPFYSTCEHHLMPFSGKVAVGYVPNKQIIGLSKIPRVVKYFSKKPQLQERLTQEICDYLAGVLEPLALYVKIYDTTHTCVTARGIETECSTDSIVTYGSRLYRDEFLNSLKSK